MDENPVGLWEKYIALQRRTAEAEQMDRRVTEPKGGKVVQIKRRAG